MLQGSLDDFALDEVLGLLSSTAKTGKLDLKGNRGNGILHLDEGQLVRATASNVVAGTEPEDVLFELLRYNDGSFSFVASDSEKGTYSQDVGVALASAEARLAEWRTIEAIVPSLRHVVMPSAELPSDEITINRNEWASLIVIGDGCPVSTLCEKLALGEVDGSRQIKSLVERGLIRVVPPRSGSTSIRRPPVETVAATTAASPSTVDSKDAVTAGTGHADNTERAATFTATPSAAPVPSAPAPLAAPAPSAAPAPAAAAGPSTGWAEKVATPATTFTPPPRPRVSAAAPEATSVEASASPAASVIRTETIGSDGGAESDDKGTGLLMRYLKSEN
ncbi:MAG: DUF4388 domain-containing protein [Actinomycetia bacterium]|nr:DUF4388 domain-containing protein [Actinomycetes bacterium]